MSDPALPAARGAMLSGQEDLLAMLRPGELRAPLVVEALVSAMVWGVGHGMFYLLSTPCCLGT